MCKDNPHEKRRKELEKQREGDNLTPLDPRNSILLGNGLGHDGKGYYRTASSGETFYPIEQQGSSQYQMHPMTRQEPHGPYHDRSPSAGTISAQSLVHSAAPLAHETGHHETGHYETGHYDTGHYETGAHHDYDNNSYGRRY